MSERKTVEGAYQKIASHERECALRYQSLEDGIADLKDTLKAARKGAWLIAVGVIGWLAVQVYDRLEHPDPQPPAPVSSTR